jgi:hypothetical protein
MCTHNRFWFFLCAAQFPEQTLRYIQNNLKTEEFDLSLIKKGAPLGSWLKEDLYLNEPVIYDHDWKTFVVQMAKQFEAETTGKIVKQFKMTFADSWKRQSLPKLVTNL